MAKEIKVVDIGCHLIVLMSVAVRIINIEDFTGRKRFIKRLCFNAVERIEGIVTITIKVHCAIATKRDGHFGAFFIRDTPHLPCDIATAVESPAQTNIACLLIDFQTVVTV